VGIGTLFGYLKRRRYDYIRPNINSMGRTINCVYVLTR